MKICKEQAQNKNRSSKLSNGTKKEEDKLTKTDGDKAEVLSTFFASVFTKEDLSTEEIL